MNLDAAFLAKVSAETGYPSDTLEKVVRLGEFLADVGRHPLLSRVLALKGGTALNLCFGPPLRLSVDLDFNYIGEVDRDRMRAERPEVERAVQIIASGQGYAVQQSPDAHAGRKFFLGYHSLARAPARIEIDINYLYRIPLGDLTTLELWQPGDITRPKASGVSAEELVAGKLLALYDRVMPRDLFDVVHLPLHPSGVLGSRLLRPVLVALSATLPHPLHSYGRDRLERVTEKAVHEQLDPMLVPEARRSAQELREQAWTVAGPYTALSDAERDFVDGLHAGRLRPELLFADNPELAGRLETHPALLWKLDNVRRRPS